MDNKIIEVSLDSFPGIRIGQTENRQGGTGITVVLSEDPDGMAAGLHIGGGGPATRETGILDPITTAQRIHAAVLGGGSAFGLDAAGGVMRYLEEKEIGVVVCDLHVPLVTQVDIFDLPVGDPRVRPDREMAYSACRMSEQGMRGNFRCGNFGAGCGATIGKYAGREHAMKSGIGSCVLRMGDLLVGAIITVNAFGDVYDWKTGKKIAGAYADDGRFYDVQEMLSFLREMEMAGMGLLPRTSDSGREAHTDSRLSNPEREANTDSGKTNPGQGIAGRSSGSSCTGAACGAEAALPSLASNTTIGIVFTNAPFKKPELCKIAAMSHDGIARSIAPVHSSGDGDSVIALSVNSGYTRPGRESESGADTGAGRRKESEAVSGIGSGAGQRQEAESDAGRDAGGRQEAGSDAARTVNEGIINFAGSEQERSEQENNCVIAGIDTVGTLAAWAASEAILRAVRSAESAYGYSSLADVIR